MKYFLFFAMEVLIMTQADAQKGCNFPFLANADSMVKFVINRAYHFHGDQAQVEHVFYSPEFIKTKYNSFLPIKYDSIYQDCIHFLRHKLGDKVMCDHVDLTMSSFYVSSTTNEFFISFLFYYPILQLEEPVYTGNSKYESEKTNFTFKYFLESSGKIRIQYPDNVPSCSGMPDCGIHVNKEKALVILREKGYIGNQDKVTIELNGIYWKVKTTQDGWSYQEMSVNIQTGEVSEVVRSQRID